MDDDGDGPAADLFSTEKAEQISAASSSSSRASAERLATDLIYYVCAYCYQVYVLNLCINKCVIIVCEYNT